MCSPNYNTPPPIPPTTELNDTGYSEWLQKYNVRTSDDYNMYAAYKSGLKPGENGHFSDEFKLPNHITYSTGSIYSKEKNAPKAGEWVEKENGVWAFKATETNIRNAGGVERMKKYFDRVEPGNTIIFPDGTSYTGAKEKK